MQRRRVTDVRAGRGSDEAHLGIARGRNEGVAGADCAKDVNEAARAIGTLPLIAGYLAEFKVGRHSEGFQRYRIVLRDVQGGHRSLRDREARGIGIAQGDKECA